MWISVKGKNSTEISDIVINRLLDIYPEENLKAKRYVFVEAFGTGSIDLKVLKDECEKLLIPWQMFFLDEKVFDKHIKHIETQRKHKISNKLLAKRRGAGDITSKRIVDRFIRQQNFLTDNNNLPTNKYPSLLSGLSVFDSANKICSYFEIDREKYWKYKKKAQALEYFINKIEQKNINICRGVLTHKLLPHHQVVDSGVYKNTSGFAIKDSKIPFIFLPSEISDEADSRQLYTLVYLLVIIGLNQYSYSLEKDFRAKKLKNNSKEKKFHDIASELLMPASELDKYKRQKLTISVRDELCQKFKVTPTALATTLWVRKLITREEYEQLAPNNHFIGKKEFKRTPYVSTSIKKFCGGLCYDAITRGIQTQTLASTQAQYLIYGGINKKGFKEFRARLGI